MSKYTTEVRFICEELAGINVSSGFKSVDDVIDKAWDKIFTTTATVFEPSYKEVICKKIIKHYYTREIGMETFGLWQLAMNTKFEEVVTLYNKLWEVEAMKFDPLTDTNLMRVLSKGVNTSSEKNTTNNTTDNKTENGTLKRTGTDAIEDNSTLTRNLTDTMQGTDGGTSNTSRNNGSTNLFSDTPQGTLSNVTNMTYLTDARQINENGTENTTVNNAKNQTDTHTGTDTTNGTSTTTHNTTDTNTVSMNGTTENKGTEKGKINTTEDWIDKLKGKSPGNSITSLLVEFREAIINVDLMFIKEFEDCFMGLW